MSLNKYLDKYSTVLSKSLTSQKNSDFSADHYFLLPSIIMALPRAHFRLAIAPRTPGDVAIAKEGRQNSFFSNALIQFDGILVLLVGEERHGHQSAILEAPPQGGGGLPAQPGAGGPAQHD